MKTITEVWYDKFSNDKGVHCQTIYKVGLPYGIGGDQCKLQSIERVADMVIFKFDKGISYEVPLQGDMSFVYKEETEKED